MTTGFEGRTIRLWGTLVAEGRCGELLAVVDVQSDTAAPHDRDNYRQQMGHVWLGFSEEKMARLLADAGFGKTRIVPLVPDARAKGPGLLCVAVS